MKALTRKEKILDGQDLTPLTRKEYFMKKAVSGGGGGSLYIGTTLTIADAPPLPEGYRMSESYTGLKDKDPCPIYVGTGESGPYTVNCVYPNMDKLLPVYIQRAEAPENFVNVKFVDFKFGNLPHVDDNPSGTEAVLTVKSSAKLFSEIGLEPDAEFFTIDKSDLEWVRIARN